LVVRRARRRHRDLSGRRQRTKELIHRVDVEVLKRDFPVAGSTPGGYFRQKGISNGRWRVEGSDSWGRRVSRDGVNPEKLLAECEAAAQVINQQIDNA
jgi:hypothetical protein